MTDDNTVGNHLFFMAELIVGLKMKGRKLQNAQFSREEN
jgi:hypothetical protein